MAHARSALVVAALLLSACTPVPPAPPTATAPIPERCQEAEALRAGAPTLQREGKIHRLLATLKRADALCPERRGLVKLEIEALIDLGAYDEALRRLDEIALDRRHGAEDALASAEALTATAKRLRDEGVDTKEARMRAEELSRKAAEREAGGDHAGAADLYEQAWRTARPNGEAMVRAGRAAASSGAGARAQRFFDRAIADLERERNSPVELDEAPLVDTYATRVVWSRGGDRLVMATERYLYLFDAATGTLILRLRHTLNAVAALALSPDGSLLAASAHGEDRLQLWDTRTGKLATELAVGESALRFSGDGSILAAANDAELLWVSTRTLSEMHREALGRRMIVEQGKPVPEYLETQLYTPCRTSDRPGYRLMCSPPETIDLYDLATAKHTGSLKGIANHAYSLVFSSLGKLGAYASVQTEVTQIMVHGLREGKVIRTIEVPEEVGGLPSIRFVPGTEILFVRGADGKVVQFLDARSGRVLRTESGSEVVATSDGGRVVVMDYDQHVIRVWDRRVDGLRTVRMAGFGDVALSPDGKTLANGGTLVDLQTGQTRVLLAAYEGDPTVARFAPDGSGVWSAHKDGAIRFFPRSGGAPRRFQTPEEVTALAVAPSSRRIATGARGATRVWDVPLGAGGLSLAQTLPSSGKRSGSHVSSPSRGSIALSPDGRSIVLGGSTIAAYDIASGRERWTLSRESYDVAWSSDGTLVLSSPGGVLVDARTGVLRGELRASDFAAFLSSERALLTVGERSCGPPPKSGASVVSESGADVLRHFGIASCDILAATTSASIIVLDPMSSRNTLIEAFSTRSGDRQWSIHLDALAADASADGERLLVTERHRLALLSARTGQILARLAWLDGSDGAFVRGPEGEIEALGDPSARPLCFIGGFPYEYDLCRERFEAVGVLRRAFGE